MLIADSVKAVSVLYSVACGFVVDVVFSCVLCTQNWFLCWSLFVYDATLVSRTPVLISFTRVYGLRIDLHMTGFTGRLLPV